MTNRSAMINLSELPLGLCNGATFRGLLAHFTQPASAIFPSCIGFFCLRTARCGGDFGGLGNITGDSRIIMAQASIPLPPQQTRLSDTSVQATQHVNWCWRFQRLVLISDAPVSLCLTLVMMIIRPGRLSL